MNPPIPFLSDADMDYCLSHHNAVAVGTAAEYLVCARALLAGVRAFQSAQGMPYDVVIEHKSRLYRVQVRATCRPKNIAAKGRPERHAYSFNVRTRGLKRRARLTDEHCDLIALVALDIAAIAWLPLKVVGQTVQLRPPGTPKGKSNRGRSLLPIDGFPLMTALEPEFSLFEPLSVQCNRGHNFDEGNTGWYGTSRYCRKCQSENIAARRASKTK